MSRGRPKIDPADRIDQRILVLFNGTDVERINRYCDNVNRDTARGHVLRQVIMLAVGKWEKRNRKAS